MHYCFTHVPEQGWRVPGCTIGHMDYGLLGEVMKAPDQAGTRVQPWTIGYSGQRKAGQANSAAEEASQLGQDVATEERNRPSNRCSMCAGWGEFPHASCRYCKEAPTRHHGRCCPKNTTVMGPELSAIPVARNFVASNFFKFGIDDPDEHYVGEPRHMTAFQRARRPYWPPQICGAVTLASILSKEGAEPEVRALANMYAMTSITPSTDSKARYLWAQHCIDKLRDVIAHNQILIG